MTSAAAVVICGVDTRKHSHHAAAVGGNGRLPGDREFPANEHGYAVARVVAGPESVSGGSLLGCSPGAALPGCPRSSVAGCEY
jgi:hypothetical protein